MHRKSPNFNILLYKGVVTSLPLKLVFSQSITNLSPHIANFVFGEEKNFSPRKSIPSILPEQQGYQRVSSLLFNSVLVGVLLGFASHYVVRRKRRVIFE